MRMRLQDFTRRWIKGREKRQGSEIAEEERQPQAANGDGHDDIGNGDGERLREIRFDDPEQIDVAHEQDPHGEPDELANVFLKGAGEENREGEGEAEEHQKQANRLPSAAQSREVERDLSGEVAGPDGEPLREVEIGPDHGEGQHPLAVIVDEVGPQHVGHGFVVGEDTLDNYSEAHGGEDFADEKDSRWRSKRWRGLRNRWG